MDDILPIIIAGLIVLGVLGCLAALYQRAALSSAMRHGKDELAAIARARSSLPPPTVKPENLELAAHLIALEACHALFISGVRNPWSPLWTSDVGLEWTRSLAASFENEQMAFDQISDRTSKLADLAYKHAAVHPDRSGLMSEAISTAAAHLTIQSIRSEDDDLRVAVHHAVEALQGLQDILTPDRLCNPHRPLGHVALNR